MMPYSTVRVTLGLLSVLCLVCHSAAVWAQSPLPYTGTNMSGGEFAKPKPGASQVYGKNFIYPADKDFDYFREKGMNIFRLPFRWEILQPEAKAVLVAAEIGHLKDAVKRATDKGGTVILDPHNYARYYGKVIGGPEVSNDDFADFWRKLSTAFKDNDKVWFGLMNEPHGMPTQQWLDAANAAIAAIRSTGAKNKILVPGNSWSGAHSWVKAGNDLLLKIQDPANNYLYEAHQYLDSDSSGTHPTVVSPTIGSERLRAFAEWCRKNHKQAFLGEFGVNASAEGQAALGDILTTMERDRDVWVGFTWWSAGPWWGEYMFTIQPKQAKGATTREERPQMATLLPHLQKSTAKK